MYDRYLLRHPETRKVIETPQYFFLRVACGLAQSPDEAIELYRLISSLDYLPATPTLFNSGTTHPQMSSCYLLDSPEDTLDGIYDRYKDIAQLSKFAGGIGVAFHRVRSRGSLIRGTNGLSNGIVPWLKTLDSSVAAVNQGGKRKGAACVYLETWHADIEEFLELRDNTGDEARRAHNLNLANWVPDLFMERVEKDWTWSLFDPKKVPHLTDLYGAEFERAYVEAEAAGLYERQVPARQLYSRMMRTLAQTGNGWMTFKDPSNLRCNQTGAAGRTVHLSNLCTEILEVTSAAETAVCNLGSINVGRFVVEADDGTRSFDFERLGRGRAHGRPLPRPRHRHQLLPHRPGRRLQRQAGAPSASARWACRTRSSSCGCRSTRPAPASCRGGSPRRSTSMPCGSRPSWPRRPAPTPRSPTPAPLPTACSSTCGASRRATRRAGRRCASASPRTACATRC